MLPKITFFPQHIKVARNTNQIKKTTSNPQDGDSQQARNQETQKSIKNTTKSVKPHIQKVDKNSTLYLKNWPQSHGLIFARTNGQELIKLELLVDNPDSEVNTLGRRQVNLNLIDIEPEKVESLNLNPLQIGDRTDAELPSNLLLVVDQVIELYVTGILQIDLEIAVVGEAVAHHGVRQEAAGEAELREDFVDRRLRSWRCVGGR